MIDPKELDEIEKAVSKIHNCWCSWHEPCDKCCVSFAQRIGADIPRLIAEVRKLQEVLEQADD